MRTFKAMQAAFYKEARQELIAGLALLTEAQRFVFKLGYAGPGTRTPNQAELDLSIEDVVAKMADDKLDWAMQQVERTPLMD